MTTILNVKGGSRLPPEPFDEQLTVISVPISDTGEDDLLAGKFAECFAAINLAVDEGGGVLVHCSEGVNRSTTIVLGYLVTTFGWSYEDAWRHVRERRPKVCPHEAYVRQVKQVGPFAANKNVRS